MRSGSQARVTDKIVSVSLLLCFLTLILGYLWWGRFEYHHALLLAATYGGAISTVVVSQIYFRDRLQDLGLRLDNIGAALRVALVPNLLLLLIMAAWGIGSQQFSFSWSNATLLYLPWAFLQQYLLQNFLLARFGTAFGRGTIALLLASGTFALIHLPNAPLAVASLTGALIWCRIFLKTPNLFVVSLSHAFLGMVLVVCFKFSGLGQLQVGRPGFAYRCFGDGVQVAAGYDAMGDPVVATLPGHNRGTPSLVRIFDPKGALRSEWTAFPEYDFSGNLAVGDVGFLDGDEVIVAPGPGTGNPPEIRVFDLSGRVLSSFAIKGFPGYGASVAVSRGHILVCPGPGPERGARVFEYRANGLRIREWNLGAIGFHNSVKANLLQVSGDEGLPSDSRLLLWGNVMSVNRSDIKVFGLGGDYLDTWKTFGTAFGLNLSPIRLGHGKMGVVTGPGSAPGHGPRVMVIDDGGNLLEDFFAYQEDSPCGTQVAAVDLDQDGADEIVLGEGVCPGQPAIVRIVGRDKKLRSQWKAY